MNLVPSGQRDLFLQAKANLWDTMAKNLTIVKEPQTIPVNLSGTYIPGYGITSNPSNISVTPESKTFPCLLMPKNPESKMEYLTQKQVPHTTLLVQVMQEARDYILDGRKNFHAVYEGKTYLITSEEEPILLLGKTYYIFKLELRK